MVLVLLLNIQTQGSNSSLLLFRGYMKLLQNQGNVIVKYGQTIQLHKGFNPNEYRHWYKGKQVVFYYEIRTNLHN